METADASAHASAHAFVRAYALPRDTVVVATNAADVIALADRLWSRAATNADGDVVRLSVDVTEADERVHGAFAQEAWCVEHDAITVTAGRALSARIEFEPPSAVARVTADTLERDPSLAIRLLLEAPAATLLARRRYQALHAGTIVGPAGAVVVRGPSGAGKSTLVAAAVMSGLGTLGDESVLVARDDADELIAAVCEVSVRTDTARLLALPASAVPADSRAEPKQRLDLFGSLSPAARNARRAATVLLGNRDRGPARLVALSAREFVGAFAIGEIPQERWTADPSRVAESWSGRAVYRLDGAADLDGAMALITELASRADAYVAGAAA